ncbi:MAG: GDP-mannose dehydrogenase, partial [Candidatus Rokuibacteriota bacterium]
MRVSVFGLGYVGCVTSAGLAKAGHEVIGVDVSRDKVDMVNAGRAPVVEPGLGDLLQEVVAGRRLCATASSDEGVERSDL